MKKTIIKTKTTGMVKRGRPALLNANLADAICAQIISGRSVNQICASPNMPSTASVFSWLAQGNGGRSPEHAAFLRKYIQACECRADRMADEILEIADDSRRDHIERKTRNGECEIVVDHENIQRARLKIDARKWLMAKMAPRKYGDRVAHEVTAANVEPIETIHSGLSAEEASRIYRELIERA